MYISTEKYNVVVWRTIHNEINIVIALLIWSAVSSGIRMPTNYSDLPASPAEVPTRRTSMRQTIHMAYTKATEENQCTRARLPIELSTDEHRRGDRFS